MSVHRLVAATARVHGMTVVTRNAKDFERAGVQVLNPFAEQARCAPRAWTPSARCVSRASGDAVARGGTGDQTDQDSRSAGREPQLA